MQRCWILASPVSSSSFLDPWGPVGHCSGSSVSHSQSQPLPFSGGHRWSHGSWEVLVLAGHVLDSNQTAFPEAGLALIPPPLRLWGAKHLLCHKGHSCLYPIMGLSHSVKKKWTGKPWGPERNRVTGLPSSASPHSRLDMFPLSHTPPQTLIPTLHYLLRGTHSKEQGNSVQF